MSDTVRVTEVLKKKLSSVQKVNESELTIEDMLIGLKTNDNNKTVQIPVDVLLNLIDNELLTDINKSLTSIREILTGLEDRLAVVEDRLAIVK